ncbi:uncharacterized protein LOC144344783 [Saccoglossus kowalevskii]
MGSSRYEECDRAEDKDENEMLDGSIDNDNQSSANDVFQDDDDDDDDDSISESNDVHIEESSWQKDERKKPESHIREKRAKLEAMIEGIKESKKYVNDRDSDSDGDDCLPRILNVYSLYCKDSLTKQTKCDGKLKAIAKQPSNEGHEPSLALNPDFDDLRRLASDDEISVMENLVEEYTAHSEKLYQRTREASDIYDNEEDNCNDEGNYKEQSRTTESRPDLIPKSVTIATQTGLRKGVHPKVKVEDEMSRSLQCKYCDIQFTDIVQHTLHSSWHYSDEKPFMCKGCGVDCGQRDKFFCHITRMVTSQHSSDGHNRNTVTVVDNFKTTQSPESPLECTYCGWKFCDVVLYTLHSSWHHSSDVPFFCKGCKTSYSSEEDLVCHITRILISPH